ncbi:hypothetical protein [Nocardia huaxiensis]|uniref:Uncharacterized protein n=1 Tax=Nocardia huaxiensis TaxID=2755382 RepID=A0A7D6VGY9_9NOCA|nr:hypothetical protein [Nocardia huaxiensis]QLY32515.1 hypothetical protein H0264_09835 [Nocardia huaxiensis]UFS93775.1 hypothetical protein LPY97_23610 [Nocardia huaxiensis]
MPPQRRKGSIGGGTAAPARNPLADEAEHTPPVSPLRDAEWLGGTFEVRSGTTASRDGATASQTRPAEPRRGVIDLIADGPEPGRAEPNSNVLTMPLPTAGDGPLSSGEQAQLEACESSIDALRVAFWMAGRALQIVRDGRLYRADHASFDDYVEKRWDMQRSYAHKLIRAWPLAARLHPLAPSINEGQIRELLPVAAAHGEDAAVTVYTTLAADVKVTAGKLREAVAVLPDHFDEGAVVARLQAWLRGDLIDGNQRTPDLFSTVESRLAALTQKVVKGSSDDPIAAREFAAKLRDMAELIERQIPVTPRMR